MKTSLPPLIFAVLLTACSSKEPEKVKAQSIVATEENRKEMQKELKSVDVEEEERRKSFSRIAFERLEHDYGNITADADYSTSFAFENTGDKPLLIYEVKTSCGCTVPNWNKKPIPPGGRDQIKVTFHPKEHQLGLDHKSVTVISNTDPGFTVLTIKANVSVKK
jgi:hypothetical protein